MRRRREQLAVEREAAREVEVDLVGVRAAIAEAGISHRLGRPRSAGRIARPRCSGR